MINGLISRTVVGKNKGQVNWQVPVLEMEIPVSIMTVFHFMRPMSSVFQQLEKLNEFCNTMDNLKEQQTYQWS